MSKELEALKGIKRAIAEHLHKQTGVSVEKHFEYLQNDTEISIVEKALTPPTAEEVCEALDKWYIDATGDLLIANINDFTYDKDEKRFYKRMLNQPHQMTICKLDTNDCIQLREPLPPHLITLIGRFYEGEIK